MTVLCVADASALHGMSKMIDDRGYAAFLEELTDRVDEGRLGFPQEVVNDLEVISREEPIWAWAKGLTHKLKDYSPDIALMRPLMSHVKRAGFDHGIQSLDGKEGSMATVACLCLQLNQSKTNFVLATEDVGEVPLRPTMEQIADQTGWQILDARKALVHLGLDTLLN